MQRTGRRAIFLIYESSPSRTRMSFLHGACVRAPNCIRRISNECDGDSLGNPQLRGPTSRVGREGGREEWGEGKGMKFILWLSGWAWAWHGMAW